MISTHWREPHEPRESELRLLDLLARQAADVIERAQAEAELRQSEERFRALVDASAQIVWTTDAEGMVDEDSPTWRALTGQTYEQRKNLGWLDAIHPDDRKDVAEAWRRAVEKKASMEIDYRLQYGEGEWRWTTARATPIFAGDGSLNGFTTFAADPPFRCLGRTTAPSSRCVALDRTINWVSVSFDIGILHPGLTAWRRHHRSPTMALRPAGQDPSGLWALGARDQ